MLVLDLDGAHRLAVAELRPEVLRLALAVVRDDGVRRLEDRVRRAVVLLERDRLRAREVALELEDVPDVGAAERVDRLVGIADREDVVVLRGEQLQEPVLRVVRVLVLVDEDVAERLLPFLLRLGEALEHVDREVEHVVEVDGVRGEELALVQLVDVGDRLVVEARDAARVLGRADQLVLRLRDLRVDAARREALRVALELLEALLREAQLVGAVVDREVRAVAEARRLAAEDPAAGGVEGHHPAGARGRADEVLDALPHLGGGLVREGDREDLGRLRADRGEQVGDPAREHAGLARPRSRDHEHRPLGREDGLPLGRIEVRQVRLWLGDRHGIDRSEAPPRTFRCAFVTKQRRGLARVWPRLLGRAVPRIAGCGSRS